MCLLGCTPPSSGPAPEPGTPSATASASRSATPVADSDLPLDVPIKGALLDDDNLSTVVAALHKAAGDLPVLKLDVTESSTTISVLTPDERVDTLQWLGGQITRVDSDVQYLKQATFQPSDYPLDQVRRMFDVADLRGVRGELVLQIVEYRPGQVLTTVTSRPASDTVFFRKDGTAVTRLGVTSVADITDGLTEVMGKETKAYAVGFNATRGYWADLVDKEDGVVRNRTRLDGLPVFETRRNQTLSLPLFDPHTINPAALAKAIARTQSSPTQECDLTVDQSLGRSAPVARIDCGGKVSYADLDGRDMTSLVET